MDSFFAEHGWAVVRGAVDADGLARLGACFDRLLGHVDAPRVWQLPDARRAEPELLAPLRAELGRTVAGLLGARSLRLLQDALILKPPGAPEIAWHRDYTYTGYIDPPRSASVRVSLGDTDEQGGCLAVLDGSHRWDMDDQLHLFTRDEGIAPGALERLPDALRDRVERAITPLPLAAGDATVHHCKTFHMSYANASPTPRRTVVVHLFDASCTLARDRMPPNAPADVFVTDEHGRLIGDAFEVLVG